MNHLDPHWTSLLADGRRVCVVMTERRHGDLRIDQPRAVVDTRRRAVVDSAWTWLRQVHGSVVVKVARPGQHAGAVADGSCTVVSRAPLAVQVADCAPVALVADNGVLAVVHVGWRGLVEGVIQSAAEVMADIGGSPNRAVVGACIQPGAYEFGSADLDRVADLFGDRVRSLTEWGSPALDLPAAVSEALSRVGAHEITLLGGDTAADRDRRWSHRARHDVERQAMVAWIEPSEPATAGRS